MTLREEAIEALNALTKTRFGDSNDDEIDAGAQCAELLAQALDISDSELDQYDEDGVLVTTTGGTPSD